MADKICPKCGTGYIGKDLKYCVCGERLVREGSAKDIAEVFNDIFGATTKSTKGHK